MIHRYEPTEWGQMDADAEGGWVSYLSHVAEVERVQALKYNQVKGWQDMLQARAYGLGAEAMRAACIAAVERLPVAVYSYRPDESLRDVGLWKSNVISALREVQP